MMTESFRIPKMLIGLVLLILVGISLHSCDADQGLGPLESKITGQIAFLSPELRPANVGEVRLAALLQFPPTGLGDIFFSEPLEFRQDTLDYELAIPPDDYISLVLLWRRKGENWSFNSLLGVYGFEPPFLFELKPVSLETSTTVVEDVDLTALWNFASADSKIHGRITYAGTKPENTEVVLLAAFFREPDLDDFASSLLDLGGLPLPVPPSGSGRNYELGVEHDDYRLVGLFWKGVDTPIDQMKLIGYYQLPGGNGEPGIVDAPEGGEVFGIDFVADYSTLPEGVRFP